MMRSFRTKRLVLVVCIVSVFIISQNISIVPKERLRKYFTESEVVVINDTNTSLHSVFQDTEIKLVKSTDGYKLADRTKVQCHGSKDPVLPKIVNVFEKYESPSPNLQVCPIWKIGTTFLKRVFMVKTDKKYEHLVNPYDIRYDVMYRAKKGFISNEQQKTRFMFVRDPYKRLLSGFVDKLLAPNPVYWNIISKKAIAAVRHNASALSKRCGHDLEFNEYVKYVILALTPGHQRIASKDGHFEQMSVMCKPCTVKYDFIGKMETFGEDSIEVIKRLNLTAMQQLLEIKGSSLAADDAIQDTCNQPFDKEFRAGYLQCITTYQALQRAWKKLQTRGLIGPSDLPITEKEAVNISHEQFLQLARTAHFSTSSAKKKEIQRNYFLEMFSTVSLEDLEKVRKIYADDFKYFEYDDRPSILFDR